MILKLSAIAAVCLLLTGVTKPVTADISTFNAAVEAGDYGGAVLAAAETWPAIDTSAPDAAGIAREFAWIAMLADEPSAALVYARFLVEQGPLLAHPDPSPAVSRVLLDWASLAATVSPQTRSRLLASLNARASIAGRDLISVRAAQVLHVEAWRAADWTQAGAAAALGIRFLDEIGAAQSPARFQMRRGMAVASFMTTKSPDAYNAIYDAAEELHDLIATTPEGAMRERLAGEYFAAAAWGDVMYSALGSRQRATPDRRMTAGANRRPIAELLYPAPGDASLPRCRVTLARNFRQPGFPFNSQFRDFGGVVVYALSLEAGGVFSEPRLLVSAPHDGMASAVEDVISSWRWRIEGAVQPPACRMPETHILTFEFALGR
jgi:dsDNA-binding SOS-regulon protein